MNPVIVIGLLFAHWVADFVCQTDYMALNKSKSLAILILHSIVYFTIICLGYEIIGFYEPYSFNMLFLLNLPAHFIIDMFSSNVTSYLWKREKRHWFFVVIGFDQFLHYVVLFLTV